MSRKVFKAADAKDLSFVTFYGSQLGQAESIAETIADTCCQYGLQTKVFTLNEVKDLVSHGFF